MSENISLTKNHVLFDLGARRPVPDIESVIDLTSEIVNTAKECLRRSNDVRRLNLIPKINVYSCFI